MALEILCTDIIDELEGRRRNVNISNIVGSSIGMFGSALALAGVIASPFTAGVSLGLTVTGAVIGSLSSATVVGANITETVLNKDANVKFERYFMNLSENCRIMERSLVDLSAILDFGVLGYSIFNLVKGSKTKVTEKLRSQRSFLRASRTQLMIYAYGNQKKYLQAVDFTKS